MTFSTVSHIVIAHVRIGSERRRAGIVETPAALCSVVEMMRHGILGQRPGQTRPGQAKG